MTTRRFAQTAGIGGALAIITAIAAFAGAPGWVILAAQWVITIALLVAAVRLARAGRHG